MVFSTKSRELWLAPAVEERLHPFLGGVARDLGCVAMAINGHLDHVHLVLRFRSKLSISELAMNIEGRSSKWVHETFPEMGRFSWASFNRHSERGIITETERRRVGLWRVPGGGGVEPGGASADGSHPLARMLDGWNPRVSAPSGEHGCPTGRASAPLECFRRAGSDSLFPFHLPSILTRAGAGLVRGWWSVARRARPTGESAGFPVAARGRPGRGSASKREVGREGEGKCSSHLQRVPDCPAQGQGACDLQVRAQAQAGAGVIGSP